MIRLAGSPMPHVTSVAHSVLDLFRINEAAHTMHRPIPAPEPNPEPNPGPDATLKSPRTGNIKPADWDALFQAVQVRLEDCVGEALHKQPELELHDRHTVTKAAVLDCVEAMKQLHSALTLERQQWLAHPPQHQQPQLQQAQQQQAH